MSSLDPFAPLTPQINPIKEQESNLEPVPITPVPPHASPAQLHHSQFGEPSATWTYKNEAGLVLGYVARFDHPDGKQILPRTWCRLPDDSEAWRWRAFESPRPVYKLDLLHGRPDDVVLLVEGEKTADAAQQCCPNYVAVTWPGGTNAIRKVDWSPLAERDVIVWPDADDPGRKAARDTAKLVLEAGAASVSLVELPDDLPTGWDLADPVPAGGGHRPPSCYGTPHYRRHRDALRLHHDGPRAALVQSRRRRKSRAVARRSLRHCRRDPRPGRRRVGGVAALEGS